MRTQTPSKRLWILSLMGALVGWFALGLQFYVLRMQRDLSLFDSFVLYFSFFTILTNLLAALTYTAGLITQRSSFFRQNATKTAIAACITVVGLVYQLVLRSLWTPTGWHQVADELLHSFLPLYFLVFWWLTLDGQTLSWRKVWPWLLYPFGYLIAVMIRGQITGEYPYPFLNVGQQGWARVGWNCLVLLGVFLGFFAFFWWMGRWKIRRT